MILTIYTDGGARGNPGPAAIGVVFNWGDDQSTLAKYIGSTTNNVAEYTAVVEAIAHFSQGLALQGIITSLVFNLDSELVVKQLGGLYKVKEPTLQTLHAKVKSSLAEIDIPYTFNHVRRAYNAAADKLVNQALDAQLQVIA